MEPSRTPLPALRHLSPLAPSPSALPGQDPRWAQDRPGRAPCGLSLCGLSPQAQFGLLGERMLFPPSWLRKALNAHPGFSSCALCPTQGPGMPAPRREKPRVRRRRDAAVTAGLPQAGLGPIPPCLEALGTPWRLSPCPPEGSKAVSGRRPTLPFSNEETWPQEGPTNCYSVFLQPRPGCGQPNLGPGQGTRTAPGRGGGHWGGQRG